jgi:N6-adenosine-specific RNA methylase IME4
MTEQEAGSPEMKLVFYDTASTALAKAARIDEVKDIRDKAVAIVAYAKLAKDKSLLADATKIKERAERRGGQLMEQQRQAGSLKRGGDRRSNVAQKRLNNSVKAQGIDVNLADRMRKKAAMTEEKFERQLAKTVAIVSAAADDNKELISAARAERHATKKAKRDKRERELAEKLIALPEKKYGVIYADPEWRWEAYSEKGLDAASADNHYRTSTTEAIKSRDVAKIAAKDCLLFLWATVPMLPQALEVMVAWGFEYKSSYCWVKDRAGTGYWSRGQFELLLIGTRGNVPAPAEGTQWSSVVHAARRGHSTKPDEFAEMIEQYYPNLPKIELNCRDAPRPGWDGWGDEAEQQAAE